MKKIYIYIIAILIILSIVGLIFLNNYNDKKEIISTVQTWMEENLQQSDYLQFDVHFSTQVNVTTVVNGVQDESLVPDDVPLVIDEKYHISIIKSQDWVKIEHQSTTYNYKDDTLNRTDTFTDQCYYLIIKDNKVVAYIPQDKNYILKSIDSAQFTDSISKLLFSTDAMFSYEDSPVIVMEEKDAYPNYNIQRSIDAIDINAPFVILYGDNMKNTPPASLVVDYGMNKQAGLPEEMYIFRIGFGDVKNLYPFAYEAWTGKSYENVFRQKEYAYEQSLWIYFYDGFNDVVEAELPEV